MRNKRTNKKNRDRKEHLKEIVEEYLGDEGNPSGDFLRDIRRACEELKSYHAERLAAYNEVEASL